MGKGYHMIEVLSCAALCAWWIGIECMFCITGRKLIPFICNLKGKKTFLVTFEKWEHCLPVCSLVLHWKIFFIQKVVVCYQTSAANHYIYRWSWIRVSKPFCQYTFKQTFFNCHPPIRNSLSICLPKNLDCLW